MRDPGEPLDRLTIGHYMLRQLVARGRRPRARAPRLPLDQPRQHQARRRTGGARDPIAAGLGAARGAPRLVRPLRRRARTIRRGMDEVRRALGWLHALGGDVLVVISGGRDGASWEDAARAYTDAYAALLPEAASGRHSPGDRGDPSAAPGPVVHQHARRRARDRPACRAAAAATCSTSGTRAGSAGCSTSIAGDAAPSHPRRPDIGLQACHDADARPRAARRGILPLRRSCGRSRPHGYRGWYEAEIISDDVERDRLRDALLRHTRDRVRPPHAGLQPTRARRTKGS